MCPNLGRFLFGDEVEKLKQKFIDFSKITKLKMHYELQNGFVLEFQFKKSNFVHMAGLHKLKDIPLIQTYSSKPGFASQIISKIKKGTFTEADVFSSKYFPLIQKRYENFTLENLFSLVYTDIVVDFDISKLAKSKLVNTKFILFEKDVQNGNRHLCIAEDALGNYYPETFFYEASDYYLKSQTLIKVKKVQMIKSDGSIYFSDEF